VIYYIILLDQSKDIFCYYIYFR